ncbi:MAG: putative toxin-antitoxin system toxin component, PIN family [Steroidobacteraceae bacterium]
MRVVADTNTVVSAFLWGGLPAQLLESTRAERITLFSSAALIAELEDVLGRQKFAARIARVGSSAPELLAGYLALTTLVRAATLAAPVSRDPDDDHVLACALAAKADLIVSGDKRHLLILGEYQGIAIRTAAEALGQLTAPSPPQQ